jgi:hypothetical protein
MVLDLMSNEVKHNTMCPQESIEDLGSILGGRILQGNRSDLLLTLLMKTKDKGI